MTNLFPPRRLWVTKNTKEHEEHKAKRFLRYLIWWTVDGRKKFSRSLFNREELIRRKITDSYLEKIPEHKLVLDWH